MKKVFVALCLVGMLSSCSEEESTVDLDTELKSVNSTASSSCGWGIYDNEEYDCGFKRGYDDWVFHYNYVAESLGYGECSKIRLATGSGSVRITTSESRHSLTIIQAAKSTFSGYWNNLVANGNANDFKRGQLAAYMNARNQQPFSELNGNCGF